MSRSGKRERKGGEGEGRKKEGGKIVMVNILLHRNDGSANDFESS